MLDQQRLWHYSRAAANITDISAICLFVHSNGLGQLFYDSNPPGTPGTFTYTLAMAQEAAAAWPLATTPTTGKCGGWGAVYAPAASSCAVWVYEGPYAGRVRLNSGTTCNCPINIDETWY